MRINVQGNPTKPQGTDVNRYPRNNVHEPNSQNGATGEIRRLCACAVIEKQAALLLAREGGRMCLTFFSKQPEKHLAARPKPIRREGEYSI